MAGIGEQSAKLPAMLADPAATKAHVETRLAQLAAAGKALPKDDVLNMNAVIENVVSAYQSYTLRGGDRQLSGCSVQAMRSVQRNMFRPLQEQGQGQGESPVKGVYAVSAAVEPQMVSKADVGGRQAVVDACSDA